MLSERKKPNDTVDVANWFRWNRTPVGQDRLRACSLRKGPQDLSSAASAMRSIRAKLDEEYEGLTLQERVARMRERADTRPFLKKWLPRTKAETSL